MERACCEWLSLSKEAQSISMSPNAFIKILTAVLDGLQPLSQKHQACMTGRTFADFVGKLRADDRWIKFLEPHHKMHLAQRGTRNQAQLVKRAGEAASGRQAWEYLSRLRHKQWKQLGSMGGWEGRIRWAYDGDIPAFSPGNEWLALAHQCYVCCLMYLLLLSAD